MKIIIDECLPKRLTKELPGHAVKTVQQMGWSAKTNGELLDLIQKHFDVFLTVDKSLKYQQNLKHLPFGLLVIRAKTNKIEDIRPLIPAILSALKSIAAGKVVYVGS